MLAILYHPIPSLYHAYTIPIPSLYHPYTVPIPSLYHPYTVPIPSLYHPYTYTKNVSIYHPYISPIPPYTALYRPIPFLYHPLLWSSIFFIQMWIICPCEFFWQSKCWSWWHIWPKHILPLSKPRVSWKTEMSISRNTLLHILHACWSNGCANWTFIYRPSVQETTRMSTSQNTLLQILFGCRWRLHAFSNGTVWNLLNTFLLVCGQKRWVSKIRKTAFFEFTSFTI